jgi:hypothetical protein
VRCLWRRTSATRRDPDAGCCCRRCDFGYHCSLHSAHPVGFVERDRLHRAGLTSAVLRVIGRQALHLAHSRRAGSRLAHCTGSGCRPDIHLAEAQVLAGIGPSWGRSRGAAAGWDSRAAGWDSPAAGWYPQVPATTALASLAAGWYSQARRRHWFAGRTATAMLARYWAALPSAAAVPSRDALRGALPACHCRTRSG